MVLKNYYTVLAGLTFCSGNMKFVNYRGIEKAYNHPSLSVASIGLFSKNINTNTNMSGNGVIFGDGNAAPTAEDYKLAGNQITTLSGSCSDSYESSTDGCVGTRTFTLTNTGSEDVTIREVATMVGFNYETIIERTVLESPVTIEAGGVGQVTYEIKMNYPI